MTINAAPATSSTIDEVILDAFKKAALLPIEFGIGSDVQWSAKAAHGRRTLNRLMASFSKHRFFEYFVRYDYLELSPNVNIYDLAVDVINVVDDGSYIPASNGLEVEQTTGETPVKPMSAFRWNQLSGKASSGIPMHYSLDRGIDASGAEQLIIRVWPVPTEAAFIRFRVHRVPGSSSTGSDNPDFKRHWELWAVYALAYELMVDSSSPLDACDRMKRDRDEAWEVIKAYDTNNTPPDVVFAHTTPWSGRSC